MMLKLIYPEEKLDTTNDNMVNPNVIVAYRYEDRQDFLLGDSVNPFLFLLMQSNLLAFL